MIINTKDISDEISRLDKIIEEYDGNIMNLKNSINSIPFFWNSPEARKISNSFFDTIKKNEISTYEIKEVRDVYNEIKNKYSSLGKKIEYNLNYEQSIYEIINENRIKYQEIINLYKSIECERDKTLYSMIKKEQDLVENTLNNLEIVCKEIKTTFSEIKELDIIISNRLSKVDVQVQ